LIKKGGFSSQVMKKKRFWTWPWILILVLPLQF